MPSGPPQPPASASRPASVYQTLDEEYLRFPHSYFTTECASPPAFPHLPPSQRRYFYLDVAPPAPVPTRATLLLLHGFPDSSYGWRRCMAPLSAAGYRVIAPDLLGYGRTSKPRRLEEYGARTMAADLAGLLSRVLGSDSAKFVVVGHDWGSWLAWKLARWIPERLMGVHGICVPYVPPTSTYIPMNKLIERFPQFGYQAFFEQPDSTQVIESRLDTFLAILFVSNAQLLEHDDGSALGASLKIFGGSPEETQSGLNVDVNQLSPVIHQAGLLTPREKLVFHFLFDPKHGGSMDGPLSWYRTRKVTFDEERALNGKLLPAIPAKMLCPRLDPVGQASLAENARPFYPTETTYRVEELDGSGHWAMLEKPESVVTSITSWIEEDVLPQQSMLRTLVPKL